MSIWTSSALDLEVPYRDNYTGEQDDEKQKTFVDVATAAAWHKLIRLSVNEDEVRLNSDEARDLACTLIFKAAQLDEQARVEAYKAKMALRTENINS